MCIYIYTHAYKLTIIFFFSSQNEATKFEDDQNQQQQYQATSQSIYAPAAATASPYYMMDPIAYYHHIQPSAAAAAYAMQQHYFHQSYYYNYYPHLYAESNEMSNLHRTSNLIATQSLVSNSGIINEIELDAINEDKHFNSIKETIKHDKNSKILIERSKSHVKASFGLNKLINIKSNNPCDGEPAIVEIHSLNDYLDACGTNRQLSSNIDPESDVDDNDDQVLHEFPGPLIK